jgi:hypothetical protein
VTANAINTRAAAYLEEWARGTRRRHARPLQYNFLNHRFGCADWALPPAEARGLYAESRAGLSSARQRARRYQTDHEEEPAY